MNLRKLSPWNWLTREEPNFSPRMWPELARREYPPGDFHQQFDRLFDQALRNIPAMPEWGESMSQALRPQLDIKEGQDHYAITVEMPGVDKEDVEVEVKEDTLIIRGEKKQETEKQDEKYHRIERRYGSFQRMLALPEDAQGGEVAASFKDGVLTVTVPRNKNHEPERKKITIQ